jgi:hypothetical protein
VAVNNITLTLTPLNMSFDNVICNSTSSEYMLESYSQT